jgi:hypothetical protein
MQLIHLTPRGRVMSGPRIAALLTCGVLLIAGCRTEPRAEGPAPDDERDPAATQPHANARQRHAKRAAAAAATTQPASATTTTTVTVIVSSASTTTPPINTATTQPSATAATQPTTRPTTQPVTSTQNAQTQPQGLTQSPRRVTADEGKSGPSRSGPATDAAGAAKSVKANVPDASSAQSPRAAASVRVGEVGSDRAGKASQSSVAATLDGGTSTSSVTTRPRAIALTGPPVSSDTSGAKQTTKPTAVRIGLDSIVAAPATATALPLMELRGDVQSQSLPRLQPQDRLEALASLRASPSERVALWHAGQTQGIVLSREQAIERLQNAGDQRVVVAAICSKDPSQWDQLVKRATAEQVRAAWLTENPEQTQDSRARQAARAAQEEADRKTRQQMSDTFFRALLGPTDSASTAAKTSEPRPAQSGATTQPAQPVR